MSTIKTRVELLEMLNDIVKTTRKEMRLELTLTDLIGNATSTEQATRNALSNLARIMVLQFEMRSASGMQALFRKYAEGNVNEDAEYANLVNLHEELFPVVIPESEADRIIKMNQLIEYRRVFCLVDQTGANTNRFVATFLAAQDAIMVIEDSLK